MDSHPLELRVAMPATARRDRLHVVIRLLLLVALAALGMSSLYWVLYVAIPAFVALRLSAGGAQRYLHEDAPRITRVLRWFAAVYAYLWLLTDELPSAENEGPVELTLEPSGQPTVRTALLRLLTSLPALLLLALLSMVAVVLWIIGAIAILLSERLPPGIADFIAMKLRYQFRLVAYHFSLAPRYPALTDVHAPPHADRPREA